MFFSKSSRNIYIDISGDSTTLYADVEDRGSEIKQSSINLDEVIGNDNGRFSRKVNGFSQSAEHIELDFKNDITWLVAELSNFDGSQRQRRKINLDLHITNNNGNLEWAPED